MITQLSERHRPLFQTLTTDEVEFVWNRVSRRWHDATRTVSNPPDSPELLFQTCRDIGLDHAHVILSFAGENGVARPVIEKLVGRPIVPWGSTVEAAREAAQAASGNSGPGGRVRVRAGDAGGLRAVSEPQRKVDNRVVAWVVDYNPHRTGTEMARMFEKWQIGDTVQQCRDRGLNARSLRRDVKHHHVKLEGVRE